MDRPNIFEALNVARDEHWSPRDSPPSLDPPSDGEDEAATAPNLDQAEFNLVEGDDLTDEDEPNVIGNEEEYRQDEVADEDDHDSDYVPESEEEEEENMHYLAHELTNYRQRRGGLGAQRMREPERDIGHLEETVYVGKDGTKWTSVPPAVRPGRTPNENVCHVAGSQLVGCGDVTEPCDAFS